VHGEGTVFEIPYVSGSYANAPTTLITFDGTDGGSPIGDLLLDPAGDLFGVTSNGGADGEGTVFEIDKTGGLYASTPTTLVSFDVTDGAAPEADLIADAAGDLFRTARYGGTNGGTVGDGTVFEIARTGGVYASTPTTLANFDGDDGEQPHAGLTADAAGNLFGTTEFGGPGGFGSVFELSNTGFVICFLPGARIATQAGEVAVEHLAVGDMVTTLHGRQRRIVWIGEGCVLVTRGRRTAATPVIVRKGALARNVPHRDLRVTKAHALYIDDALIPVEFLVNHRSILWDDRAREVKLYHIELETHDVLLANGAPVESYRDGGNRWLFRNADSGSGLPPQQPCAPVLTGGPIVDAA
jgi:uncharacterized repeat protein (TIGR03803 family)